MSQISELQALAGKVAASTALISTFCEANNAEDVAIPNTAPKEILKARQEMVEAAAKIQQIAMEPSQYLPQLAIYPQQIACLRWLCRFNIPNLIPLKGSISYSELAGKANVPEHLLKSVARMAMCANFLQELSPGMIAHNKISTEFVCTPSLSEWAIFLAEATTPVAAKLFEATEKWGNTRDKTQTAFSLAMDTQLPFFDYLAESPAFTKRFAGYMKSVAAGQGASMKHLINGFDWAKLGEAKIVDIGGSSGHASIALAEKFSSLKFVVQDLPNVIDTLQANLSSLEPSVTSRITFQAHDFFGEQPITDADAYLLRMILHDWPDKEASLILSNLVPALEGGGRLIIMDTALPTPGSIGADQEAQLRVRDLTMLETFNSHEREIDEWERLLHSVDRRLKLNSLTQPFESHMAIMEVVLS